MTTRRGENRASVMSVKTRPNEPVPPVIRMLASGANGSVDPNCASGLNCWFIGRKSPASVGASARVSAAWLGHFPRQFERQEAVTAIAAPRAGVVETELADDAGRVDRGPRRIERGGEAQVDLIGAGAQHASGDRDVKRAVAGLQPVEWIKPEVGTVTFVDDGAVEPLQRHVAVEPGHPAGCRIVDAHQDVVIAIEAGGRTAPPFAPRRHAAHLERLLRGRRRVANEYAGAEAVGGLRQIKIDRLLD